MHLLFVCYQQGMAVASCRVVGSYVMSVCSHCNDHLTVAAPGLGSLQRCTCAGSKFPPKGIQEGSELCPQQPQAASAPAGKLGPSCSCLQQPAAYSNQLWWTCKLVFDSQTCPHLVVRAATRCHSRQAAIAVCLCNLRHRHSEVSDAAAARGHLATAITSSAHGHDLWHSIA